MLSQPFVIAVFLQKDVIIIKKAKFGIEKCAAVWYNKIDSYNGCALFCDIKKFVR